LELHPDGTRFRSILNSFKKTDTLGRKAASDIETSAVGTVSFNPSSQKATKMEVQHRDVVCDRGDSDNNPCALQSDLTDEELRGILRTKIEFYLSP